MKKIEILVREVNLDNVLQEIEHKRFRIKAIEDDKVFDEILPHLLDNNFEDLKAYYLRNRDAVPFGKIRRDYENKTENQ